MRTICASLIGEIPEAAEDGFFIIEGEKYGTQVAWSKLFGAGRNKILKRIISHKLEGIKGKDKRGHIQTFYSESVIRQISMDLSKDFPVASEEGFLMIDGQRFFTIRAFSKIFGVSGKAITSRVIANALKSVKGKARGGQIYDFYSESAIRQICADILEKRKNS